MYIPVCSQLKYCKRLLKWIKCEKVSLILLTISNLSCIHLYFWTRKLLIFEDFSCSFSLNCPRQNWLLVNWPKYYWFKNKFSPKLVFTSTGFSYCILYNIVDWLRKLAEKKRCDLSMLFIQTKQPHFLNDFWAIQI